MSSGNNGHGYEDRVIKAVEKNPVKTKTLEYYDPKKTLEHYEPKKTLEPYEPKNGTKRKNNDAFGEENKIPKH